MAAGEVKPVNGQPTAENNDEAAEEDVAEG